MDIDKTEKQIEFDKVKEMWLSLALTDAARAKILQMWPYLSEDMLKKEIRETSESRKMIEKCGNPPVVSLKGIEELLHIAGKGDCLSVAELLQIESALTAVSRMKSYLKKGESYEISLAFFEQNLDPLEEVREAVSVTIINDRVSDNASGLLKSLRYDIAFSEEKMKEKAESAIRTYKDWLSDHFSTTRNGHLCIPVKKEYKSRIAGSVMDKSSTGNTLFMEPEACAGYYEELQLLRIEEENEVHRILYELTALIASRTDIIQRDIEVIEKMDFIFSKGKLSLEYGGCEPRIIPEREIRLEATRHPLMDANVCVPLNFSMGNGYRGIVITGPNTGGKTVALKTVALNCMMAQCGLHVSCKKAEICMQSNFLGDIGDGQNISENLSTFSAHITNVLDILKSVNEESLVVMDELGSGTDPLEGMAIAVAILEELKKSGALFLVTTHYPEAKVYAEKAEGIVNARMSFDKANLRPLYRIEIGEAGESCAFYIARRLGMPVHMLKRAAAEAYGRGHEQEQGQEQGFLEELSGNTLEKEYTPRIVKKKEHKAGPVIHFRRGDSVMVYPDKKIGIVCREADDKGVLQVQLPGKKIWINHRRIKLHVAAEELYPEDYDFSIIFDSVENRKLRHQMEKRHVEGQMILHDTLSTEKQSPALT